MAFGTSHGSGMPLHLTITVASCFTLAAAFPSFLAQVPNAKTVPFPGSADGLCQGLGHKDCIGGQLPLNAFGNDLKAAGYEWTKELCEKDSDGDGYTNGEELGDPCCRWSLGVEGITSAISHPGVAELIPPSTWAKPVRCAPPYGKPACPRYCGGHRDSAFLPIENQADRYTEKIDLSIDPPAQKDLHMCRRVDLTLPTDPGMSSVDEWELVGFQFENTDHKSPLHDLFVVNCIKGDDSYYVDAGTEWPCPSMTGCSELVAGWSPGGWGQGGARANLFTTPEETGLKLHTKKVVVQYHWYNPDSVALKERSQFHMHFTKKPRLHQSAILWTGNVIFGSPLQAEVANIDVATPCKLGWKNTAQQDITVWATRAHMHSHGKSAYTEVLTGDGAWTPQKWERVGDNLNYDINDQSFKYLPVRHDKKASWTAQPQSIKQGSMMRTHCLFNTMSAAKANTHFGYEKADEMCINYFMYYPYQPDINLWTCSNLKNFNKTSYSGYPLTTQEPFKGVSGAAAHHVHLLALLGAFIGAFLLK